MHSIEYSKPIYSKTKHQRRKFYSLFSIYYFFTYSVSPDLKRANHFLNQLSLIVASPKSLLKSRNDCFPSLLEMIKHNMTNMSMIIDKHFYNLNMEEYFYR